MPTRTSARRLQEIDGHFAEVPEAGRSSSCCSPTTSRRRLRRATYSQPLLLALQVATVRALEALGLAPAATLGHSVGEIAAAWAAGALSLEQAIDVVIARSRHQEAVRGSGGMAALMLSEREARRFLKATDAAGHRRGRRQQLAQRHGLRAGRSRSIKCWRWRRSNASARGGSTSTIRSTARWSIQCGRRCCASSQGLKPLPARKRIVSSVTGAMAEARGAGAGALVAQRARAGAVRGRAGLPARGRHAGVRRDRPQADPRRATCATRCARPACAAPSSRRSTETGEDDDSDPIERAVARVMIAGGQIDLRALLRATAASGDAPARSIRGGIPPFQVRPTAEAGSVFRPPSHPLLGSRPRLDASEWFSTIDPVLVPVDRRPQGGGPAGVSGGGVTSRC